MSSVKAAKLIIINIIIRHTHTNTQCRTIGWRFYFCDTTDGVEIQLHAKKCFGLRVPQNCVDKFYKQYCEEWSSQKVKRVKVGFLYGAAYAMTGPARFTISQVVVDWQEPMCCRANCGRPIARINVQLDQRYAASKHTTAPINRTRPSPRKHSPDVATRARKQTSDYSLLLNFIYIERMKGWVGLVGWPIADGLRSHPSTAGQALDSESSSTKNWRSPLYHATNRAKRQILHP